VSIYETRRGRDSDVGQKNAHETWNAIRETSSHELLLSIRISGILRW